MIFNFRKREQRIERKEQEIQREKKKLHKEMDDKLKLQKEVNKYLGNGITLKVYHITGGRNGR